MGWWITLGILILLAILPLGISIRYDEDGTMVRVILGPVRFTVFPRPKKEKKPGKEKKTKTEEPKSQPAGTDEPAKQPAKNLAAQPEEKKKSGGPISDFLPLLQIVMDMLGAFRRRLRLNVLELKLIMAADDPSDLAVNYGRAWAAVGNLMPRIEKLFVIKKRNIEVECDFEATQTRAIARLDLTITLGRLLATVFYYGGEAGLELMKINKKRKGGAFK